MKEEEAHELWALAREAYERRAWRALGYGAWGDYYEAEFSEPAPPARRLLGAGRVLKQLPSGDDAG